MLFRNWAMPVKKRRWAALSVVTQKVNKATGWRIPRLAHLTHYAWERAVGVG